MNRVLLTALGVGALLAAPPLAADPNLPYLLTLNGELCPVRYSPGGLDRAAHVQMRLSVIASDFSHWGTQPYGFQAYVLGPEDWAGGKLRRPYGLPERTGTHSFATAAWGDDQSVALWKKLMGGDLPWGGDMPVRGTPEEAASLSLADLMLGIEIARTFVEGEHLSGDQPWIAPLMTHTVALQAFASHENVRLEEIASVWSRLSVKGLPSLAACAAPDGMTTALACEARFYSGAQVLLAKDGLKTVRHIMKLTKKRGLSEATLVKDFPGLADWLADGRK